MSKSRTFFSAFGPAVAHVLFFALTAAMLTYIVALNAPMAFFGAVNALFTGHATPSGSALANILPGLAVLAVICALLSVFLWLHKRQASGVARFAFMFLLAVAAFVLALGIVGMTGAPVKRPFCLTVGAAVLSVFWLRAAVEGWRLSVYLPVGYAFFGAALALAVISAAGVLPSLSHLITSLVLLPLLPARGARFIALCVVAVACGLAADALFSAGDALYAQIPLSRFAMVLSLGSAAVCAAIALPNREPLSTLLLSLTFALLVTVVYVIKRSDAGLMLMQSGLAYSFVMVSTTRFAGAADDYAARTADGLR